MSKSCWCKILLKIHQNIIKSELGNLIIVVLNLKERHVFHSSTRVDWLSTKVCIFPQCHFLWPCMHGNLCSEKTKVLFYNCSIILQHNFHPSVFCHIQHNHMFLTKMHSKDQRLRNSWNMNNMNSDIQLFSPTHARQPQGTRSFSPHSFQAQI